MSAALYLPPLKNQTAFNLKRWAEISADPFWSSLEGRIETDASGNVIMSLPPGFAHSSFQGEILHHLRIFLLHGKALPECPISTSDGIKAADVVWISPKRLKTALKENVLIKAPEICIEVASPSNTKAELMRKKALYFESGAQEVWICDLKGKMFFYLATSSEVASRSVCCPSFPTRLTP